MEYAKEKFYEVMYNTRLDRLVIRKERLISKVKRFIRTHKRYVYCLIFIICALTGFIVRGKMTGDVSMQSPEKR